MTWLRFEQSIPHIQVALHKGVGFSSHVPSLHSNWAPNNCFLRVNRSLLQELPLLTRSKACSPYYVILFAPVRTTYKTNQNTTRFWDAFLFIVAWESTLQGRSWITAAYHDRNIDNRFPLLSQMYFVTTTIYRQPAWFDSLCCLS